MCFITVCGVEATVIFQACVSLQCVVWMSLLDSRHVFHYSVWCGGHCYIPGMCFITVCGVDVIVRFQACVSLQCMVWRPLLDSRHVFHYSVWCGCHC